MDALTREMLRTAPNDTNCPRPSERFAQTRGCALKKRLFAAISSGVGRRLFPTTATNM
jgi:hypothetical protein